MTMAVGRAARWLGLAGLLPQLIAVGVLGLGQARTQLAGILVAQVAMAIALLYAALILSFLGGIWWGFAMARTTRQGSLAACAVVPSLVALGLVAWGFFDGAAVRNALVAMGVAIIATLPVDRHLVRSGDAPTGWMALRIPLSLGLGVLTIIAGVLGARLGGLA